MTTIRKPGGDGSATGLGWALWRRNSTVTKIILDNFVWLLVFIVLVVALITTPSFYKTSNLVNLLVQSVVLGLLVLAEMICLINGYFDLSIESILIFTAVLAAWLVAPHPDASGLELNGILGIVIMLAAGAFLGGINGVLISYIKMNAFITTLAMSIVLIGACTTISHGNTLGPFPESFAFFGTGELLFIPMPIIILVIMYIIFYFVFKNTVLGRKFFSVGGNRNASQASGIDVKKMVLIAYILSGLISAVGGLVLSGRMGSAVSHMTKDNLLYAFAACVIGGVNPFGGQGNIISVFGGVILLVVVNKLLIIAQVNPFMITAASGLIIFLAMLILTIKQNLVTED